MHHRTPMSLFALIVAALAVVLIGCSGVTKGAASLDGTTTAPVATTEAVVSVESRVVCPEDAGFCADFPIYSNEAAPVEEEEPETEKMPAVTSHTTTLYYEDFAEIYAVDIFDTTEDLTDVLGLDGNCNSVDFLAVPATLCRYSEPGYNYLQMSIEGRGDITYSMVAISTGGESATFAADFFGSFTLDQELYTVPTLPDGSGGTIGGD